MTPTIKSLLISASVIAAGAAVVYNLAKTVAKTVMEEAMDREEPKAVRKIKERNYTRSDLRKTEEELKDQREKLRNLDFEEAEILSKDGLRLVGHYYEVPNAKRTVVAVHGWRSFWDRDFCGSYQFMFDNGCNVLFIEQRGQGKSEGDYMTFGLMERYDVQSWVLWLEEHHPSDLPIFLIGISMGATSVLMASALELPKRVHGIIADCGFTSPKDIRKHVTEANLHLSFALHQSFVDHFSREKTSQDNSYSTEDALRETTIPVLLIHGSSDSFVPVEMTYRNYQACASEKRLLIVPGATHGLSFIKEPEKYKKTVLDFWAEFDNKAVPDKPTDEQPK
ncbi:MAG: alpha/beta hydrolase [Clostridia bacterium]|nr:alpha/beta hydrolase [Clostridia bacterium]